MILKKLCESDFSVPVLAVMIVMIIKTKLHEENKKFA